MSKAEQKWDQRYRNKLQKSDQSTKPHPPDFLIRHWSALSKSRVLDLGAGDGAVSLFLAEKGFSICAVDISTVGLEILQSNIAPMPVTFDSVVMDLEVESADLSALGSFDAIVISRYKPVNTLWPQLVSALKPEGTLMITTFNHRHHDRTGFPLRFCLQPNEYIEKFPELQLIQSEIDQPDMAMDSYLFKKLSP